MASNICGEHSEITDHRAASTRRPLAASSAQSSPPGPQLAACALCVTRVISYALFLRPGVSKLWIPY